MKEQTQDRLRANMLLIEILASYLTDCPDMRFNQALMNLEAVSGDSGGDYYEEPMVTLKRVQVALTKSKRKA